MNSLSRRDFLYLSLAATASAGLSAEDEARAADEASPVDVHEQILKLAARQEEERRARFAAIRSKGDLEALQQTLRQTFLRLLGGLPEAAGVPPVRKTGLIEADDYVVEKLAYESLPGYLVPALLYKPKKVNGRLPAVLSPCGHSTNGKAYGEYQTLHINLVKRGYVVLTYDPVGQGERSQFWDAANRKSRFNLSCGEHAVLGNPLYLLGGNFARYRICDGMRGVDYLTSLPEVDAAKIGCVGNSGGGTLTAYISALDPRVAVAAIGCYITTLRRRMANRIQEDPSADPEQDIFGFVGEGIDHAGLLALIAPRPALLATAQFDFFPLEGAKETFAEAKRLYEAAGAGDRIDRAEAAAGHGLSQPLRKAVYRWFDRWLAGRQNATPVEEIEVAPRPDPELLVCADGQVNSTFRSRPFLPLALEDFDKKPKPAKVRLRDLLRLDLEQAAPHVTEIAAVAKAGQTLVICINGNEARDWRAEAEFLESLQGRGHAVVVVDPRGVGTLRPKLTVTGHEYADPLDGVEENIAYNAFLVGKSLLGMRVSDVLKALPQIMTKTKPQKVVLCGRNDAALVACMAAAIEPAIDQVATEELLLSFRPLFAPGGYPINAASLLPGLLERFGDVADVLAQIAPRRVLIAAGIGDSPGIPSVQSAPGRFSREPRLLMDWLRD
jgi:dienelactone hydrolase/pimeloyl-ACP methyl ester carboxylesterase